MADHPLAAQIGKSPIGHVDVPGFLEAWCRDE